MTDTTEQPPANRAAGERAWLVFRLGTHVMCASALDVVALLEKPASIVTLPLAPPYLLGTFLFRDRPATAISLRRKLRVRDGEDTDRGPFIAARVRDSIVAFWVDEVRDVLDDPGVPWRSMPEELDGGLFDGYTIRDDELILHTRFATLFDAPAAVDTVSQWAAQTAAPVPAAQDDAADAGPAPEPETPGEAAGASAAEATRPAPHSFSASTTAPAGPARRSARRLRRIEPARRAGPRRETEPRSNRPANATIQPAPDPWQPRATQHSPRAMEVPLVAPESAPHGGRPRFLRAAAGLAVLGVILAVLWTIPSSQPPPADPVPAPAKAVQSAKVAFTGERAEPPRQRTPVKPRAAAPGNTRKYVVVRGDTLWAIARRFLGDPYRYPELVRGSRIVNPDLIHPGDIVRIKLSNARL